VVDDLIKSASDSDYKPTIKRRHHHAGETTKHKQKISTTGAKTATPSPRARQPDNVPSFSLVVDNAISSESGSDSKSTTKRHHHHAGETTKHKQKTSTTGAKTATPSPEARQPLPPLRKRRKKVMYLGFGLFK